MFLFWIDDVGFYGVSGGEGECNAAERGNELILIGLLDGEDIHVEIVAGAQELNGLVQLRVEAVIERARPCFRRASDERQACRPLRHNREAKWRCASCGIPGRW
jgi:hypothetical protein